MSAASAARIFAPGAMTWSPMDRVALPAKPLSYSTHTAFRGAQARRSTAPPPKYFPPNLAEELQGDADSAWFGAAALLGFASLGLTAAGP